MSYVARDYHERRLVRHQIQILRSFSPRTDRVRVSIEMTMTKSIADARFPERRIIETRSFAHNPSPGPNAARLGMTGRRHSAERIARELRRSDATLAERAHASRRRARRWMSPSRPRYRRHREFSRPEVDQDERSDESEAENAPALVNGGPPAPAVIIPSGRAA